MADNSSAKTGNPWSIRLPWPLEERIEQEAKRMDRSKIGTLKWLLAYALQRLDAEREFRALLYLGEDSSE